LQVLEDLLDRTNGWSSEAIGQLVGVSHPQIGKWRRRLDAGEPPGLRPSTRARIEGALLALGRETDYARGWRDALEWIQGEAGRKMDLIAGAAFAAEVDDAVDEVQAGKGSTKATPRKRNHG